MGTILLDTDVLIDHIRGNHPLDMGDTAISVITRTELFAGSEREESAVDGLLEDCEEVRVDPQIARRAGQIKRHTGLLIADALIAATALEHKLPLMTRNRRHFERVPGLTLCTPEAQTRPTTPGSPPDAPRPQDTPPDTPPRGGIESA